MNIMNYADYNNLVNDAIMAKTKLSIAFARYAIACGIETTTKERKEELKKRVYEEAAIADRLLSGALSEVGMVVDAANTEHKKPQLTCPYCGEKVDICGELFEGDGKEPGMGICCQKCGKFCMIVFKLEKAKELEK